MKKSTLIATTAAICAIATLTAANLKLKSEYHKGNIRDSYTTIKLPAFKYIKVVFDSSSRTGEEFKINISKGADYSIGTYFDERAKILSRVSNDTLIITNDTLDKEHSLYDAVVITAPQLKGIDVTKGSYLVKQENAENFSVIAHAESKVDLKLKKVDELMITASDKASIIVSSKDTINQASIQLNNQSSFSANNIVIKQKKLQLGDSASLQIQGRSLKNFGIQ